MSAAATPQMALVERPRKPRLVDLLDEGQAIIDTLEGLDEADDEARDALSQKLIACVAGTRTKIDATVAALGALVAAELAAKTEAARLKARAEYFARQAERLQHHVLAVLDASGLQRLEGNTSTLVIRKNPPAVQIDDAGEIPPDYMRSLPMPDDVPDKTAIKAALKRGEDVPGCRLAQSTRLDVI